MQTLLAGGVEACFSNSGGSEMHFVAELDRIPGMCCVLCLQENVPTGDADSYFRVAGKPASTFLHCGPGLANGFAAEQAEMLNKCGNPLAQLFTRPGPLLIERLI